MAKKQDKKANNTKRFGSPFTKEQWDEFEILAESNSRFQMLFEEYKAIYKSDVIDAIRTIQQELEYMASVIGEAKHHLPGFVNLNPKKDNKPSKKKKDEFEEEAENIPEDVYDEKAWDRYSKVITIFTKLTTELQSLKATLGKDDAEDVGTKRSFLA